MKYTDSGQKLRGKVEIVGEKGYIQTPKTKTESDPQRLLSQDQRTVQKSGGAKDVQDCCQACRRIVEPCPSLVRDPCHLPPGTNVIEVQKNTGHRNLKTLKKYAGVVDQYYREVE